MKLVISNNKQRDTTESEIMRLLYTGIAGAALTMIVDCLLGGADSFGAVNMFDGFMIIASKISYQKERGTRNR